MKINSCLVFLSLLLISSTSLADGTISIISDSGQSTLLVKNGRILLRADDPSNTASVQNRTISEAIFDTSNETLYVIDHEQQTVSPVTRESMEQFGETLNAAAGVLDSMPEDQRETISGFMKGLGLNLPEKQASPAAQLVPITMQEFRGIRCQESQLLEDQQELGRVCITEENSTPLTEEDFQTLLSAQTFFLSLAQHAAPFAQQYGQTMPNLDGLEINGLIVSSQQTQQNESAQSASFTISSIEIGSLTDIQFPDSYQIEPLF